MSNQSEHARLPAPPDSGSQTGGAVLPSASSRLIDDHSIDEGATRDEAVVALERRQLPQPELTRAEETWPRPASIDTSRTGETSIPRSAGSLSGEFGRYRIERLLGEGAMGSVYLAQDTQLNRAVALKVPKTTAMSTSTLVERFYREARTAATLRHPGICPVYDVGQIGDRHYLTMGYIDGRPLDLYVERNKNQPERRVVSVVRKIALALQEAHDHGIIHRDLKPANIMIDKRNDPIVMDFGLARLTDEQEARLTREGTVMGSPAYMSPEQVRGVRDIGPSTDIYSLGVVLYELLTGATPFQGTIATVISNILHSEPPLIKERRPDISPELAAICQKAMAKSVDERYRSMQDFSDDLAKFRAGEPTSTTLISEVAPAATESVVGVDAEMEKKRAMKLLKSEKFTDAVAVLSTLTSLQGATNSQVVEWAKSKLPDAQKKLHEQEEAGRSLVRRAKKCMDSADYERALALLDRIPPQLSSSRILADMRADARELSDELAQLSFIMQSPKSIDQTELLYVVERILELKPDHRQANDLYDRLSQENATRRQSKRKTRHSSRSSKSKPVYLWGLGLLVVVLASVVIAQSIGKNDKAPNQPQTASDTKKAIDPPQGEVANGVKPAKSGEVANVDAVSKRGETETVEPIEAKTDTEPAVDTGANSNEPVQPPNRRPVDDRPFQNRPFPPPRPGENGFRPGPGPGPGPGDRPRSPLDRF